MLIYEDMFYIYIICNLQNTTEKRNMINANTRDLNLCLSIDKQP